MPSLRILHLDSLAALRATAEAWDDLWQRSAVTLPSLRAELLAQWCEQFVSPDRFHAIAVEAGGQLVAALPLVSRARGRLLSAAAMPSNEWSASGELLLDSSVGQPAVGAAVELPHPRTWGGSTTATPSFVAQEALDALATAIREIPCSLLWLDEAVLDSLRWQQLRQAFAGAKMTVAEHRRWQVGQVKIDGDWPAYKARWSRKHRQKMAWAARQLAKRGEVRLAVHRQFAPGEVAALVRQGFEIEDRSWKGAAGTSVLRAPGMEAFFLRQAETAAPWGQLELVFLHCGDRPVAFAYGLTAKGVFHSIKVGYDPDFAEQLPGQLLRYYLLERFFADPERKALDFQGPMTEAHAAWLPERYAVGRLAVAPRQWLGRLTVWAYRHFGPCVRAFRQARSRLGGR